MDSGEIAASTGTGFARTVNHTGAESPPPGVRLKTVTSWLPAADINAGAIQARSAVLLTYSVGRSVPLKRATEVGR